MVSTAGLIRHCKMCFRPWCGLSKRWRQPWPAFLLGSRCLVIFLSPTHGICPTLTTPSPGALWAPSWLWLCLCLSPSPRSRSAPPRICLAPPPPGPAPSRLRQLLPVCADSGSCCWSVCPVPMRAQSGFPDLRSLPFPLLVLNIVLPAASPKTELTLSNLAWVFQVHLNVDWDLVTGRYEFRWRTGADSQWYLFFYQRCQVILGHPLFSTVFTETLHMPTSIWGCWV